MDPHPLQGRLDFPEFSPPKIWAAHDVFPFGGRGTTLLGALPSPMLRREREPEAAQLVGSGGASPGARRPHSAQPGADGDCSYSCVPSGPSPSAVGLDGRRASVVAPPHIAAANWGGLGGGGGGAGARTFSDGPGAAGAWLGHRRGGGGGGGARPYGGLCAFLPPPTPLPGTTLITNPPKALPGSWFSA